MAAQHGAPEGGPTGGPVPPPSEPPPTPYERAAVAPDAGRGATPRAARRRRAAVAAVAVLLVAAGAVLLTGRGDDGPDAAGDPAVGADAGPDTGPDADADAGADAGPGDPAVDAALLAVLDDVDAGELAMLGFDDAAGAAFADATTEEEAVEGVGAAAGDAVAALGVVRDRIATPVPVPAAETVRAAYLPHLDAWIAYLAAVADDPTVLAGDDAEPFILRINATAGVFAAALEEVVAAGVGPDVAAAATAILERGFPAQGDAQL